MSIIYRLITLFTIFLIIICVFLTILPALFSLVFLKKTKIYPKIVGLLNTPILYLMNIVDWCDNKLYN